jgi:mycothiol S-conjugate amidase
MRGRREGFPEPVVTTQVDVGAWLGRRRDALIAHATQIDPNSFWFAIPDEVTAEIYPWEDYTLARSLVPTSEHEDRPVPGHRRRGHPIR